LRIAVWTGPLRARNRDHIRLLVRDGLAEWPDRSGRSGGRSPAHRSTVGARNTRYRAAWAAHALRRDALTAARVTNKTEEIEALGNVLVGSEVLRSDLMRARVLLQEKRNVHAFRDRN
jgi:hypothetical protein